MDHDSDSLTDHRLIKYKLRWIQRIPYVTLSNAGKKALHVQRLSFSSTLLKNERGEFLVANRSRSTDWLIVILHITGYVLTHEISQLSQCKKRIIVCVRLSK